MRFTSMIAVVLILGGLAFAQTSSPAAPQKPVEITIPTQGTVTLDQLLKRQEDLQKRLVDAKQTAAQMDANIHALEGAIADEQQWIDGLKAQAEKAPPATPKQSH